MATSIPGNSKLVASDVGAQQDIQIIVKSIIIINLSACLNLRGCLLDPEEIPWTFHD
jgi:hypothetical protein